MLLLWAKDRQPSPKAGKSRKGPPLKSSEGARPCQQLKFGFLASVILLTWRGGPEHKVQEAADFSPVIRFSQVHRSKVPSSLTHTDLAFGCGFHICFLHFLAYLVPREQPWGWSLLALCAVAFQSQNRHERWPEPQNMIQMVYLQGSRGGPQSQLSRGSFRTHRETME